MNLKLNFQISIPHNLDIYDWNSEFLEITNSHNWGLFLRFPHVIEN
jgi:hypothetical protein